MEGSRLRAVSPGGAQLLVRSCGQGVGAQVLEGLEGAGAGAGGRRRGAGCGAATRRRPAGCAPRRAGDRPARGATAPPGSSASASLGSAVSARPKATVASAHGRPVASANRASSSVQARAVAVVAGADGCLDPLGGRHPRQHGEPEPAEVVQGPDVVPGPGGAKSLGPAGQVVHGVGQDAQRVRRDQLVEPGEEVVVVVSVLEGREQRQPGDRQRGHRRLADARRRARWPPRRCCAPRRGRRRGSGRSTAAAGSRRRPSPHRPRVPATGRSA